MSCKYILFINHRYLKYSQDLVALTMATVRLIVHFLIIMSSAWLSSSNTYPGSAVRPRHSAPQPHPPAPPGGSQVPCLAERYNHSNVSEICSGVSSWMDTSFTTPRGGVQEAPCHSEPLQLAPLGAEEEQLYLELPFEILTLSLWLLAFTLWHFLQECC